MDSNPVCHPFPANKNEMLVFGLHSTSDDQLHWSVDSNPICHPSPAKKIKCSFLDYIQLLMIGHAGRWTQTPSATPLQPKKWNACFWIMFNFWWMATLVNGFETRPPALCSQKIKCSFLDYVQLMMVGHDGRWFKPICYPSPAKKIKCLFLNYVQLLVIGRAGQWTQTPSATPLRPKK